MENSNIEPRFSFMLPVVIFSIAAVFSLFQSPAQALTDAQCEAWAKEIKGRVEDVKDDPDFTPGTIRGNTDCPNLCENEQDGNDISVSPFLRQPAGVLAATITDILTSPGDTVFINGQYGTAAFFCVVPEIDANNFREAIVGIAHPTPTSCGTGFTQICRTSLSSPVPIE